MKGIVVCVVGGCVEDEVVVVDGSGCVGCVVGWVFVFLE